MAKCACCGKGVAFGIKVSHSHRRSNRTWSPKREARKSCRGWVPEVYLRLHPLPAFGQDHPRGLIRLIKIAGHVVAGFF